MRHGTTITPLTRSFTPEKQLTDINETHTKKTVRTDRTTRTKTKTKRTRTLPKGFGGHLFTEMRNTKKTQPRQNNQHRKQKQPQILQRHPPKKLLKPELATKTRKLQRHHHRMWTNLYLNQGQQGLRKLKLALPPPTKMPLIAKTKVWSNLAPTNQRNNLPL